MRKPFALVLATLLLVMLLTACGDDGVPATATARPASTAATAASPAATLSGTLTVFAAASLTDAFTAIAEAMMTDNPDLTIEFNFAGSQQLVTQLAEGADADVFASANQSQLDAAREQGVVEGEGVVFTRNRLVVIVPADNPAGITDPADLARDGVKLVIANEEAPVGRYTLEMLDLMTVNPGFGANFRARVEENVVSLEDNVKQVVSKVRLGEADAGVVYVTDVTPDVAGEVAMIEVPGALNVIAAYPIAPVVDGDAELAQAFIDTVLSEQGQAILADFGFTPLED